MRRAKRDEKADHGTAPQSDCDERVTGREREDRKESQEISDGLHGERLEVQRVELLQRQQNESNRW